MGVRLLDGVRELLLEGVEELVKTLEIPGVSSLGAALQAGAPTGRLAGLTPLVKTRLITALMLIMALSVWPYCIP